MDVGILGGSFDPPHTGHLIIAEHVADAAGLNHILWIPNSAPPHKRLSGSATPEQRLEMVHLAVQGNPRFRVSDIELRRGGTSYTVDTLHALREAYPADARFRLVIGEDSLAGFADWRSPEVILQGADLVVYGRSGVDSSTVDPSILSHATLLDAPHIDISSTLIRERIREGKSVRYLLPPGVQDYIRDHHLYRMPEGDS